jgi:hypothetical protein
MDRKTFLKTSWRSCLACCGALAGLKTLSAQTPAGKGALSADMGRRVVEGAKSPDWRRAEKSLSWIKNMLTHLDAQVDEETRIKLLNACGRSCYIFAQGVADDRKLPVENGEGFLQAIEKAGHRVERGPEITVVYFGYNGEQNPQGLSLREGYCMCPIVETDVPDLSPSFCNCSAGYVKEIVERNSGRTVRKVEVLESVRRGGRDCRFRLELLHPEK